MATNQQPPVVAINPEGATILSRPHTPEETSTDAQDIYFPNHTQDVSHIAVDIGGSLAKVVYFTRDPDGGLGGRLNFTKFETENIDQCIAFISRLISSKKSYGSDNSKRPGPQMSVMATGGGAYKYYDQIRSALGVEIYREDEMSCLIVGLDFFMQEIPNEVFTYSDADPMRFVERRSAASFYPYLLVNIGSGVSMIKVSGPDSYERIGGSSLGGGTLWGLLSLLTGASSFDEMLTLSAKGDNANVDMLVGDIYGTDYGKIGLKASTIASSFGKVFKQTRNTKTLANGEAKFRPEDISKSLLFAISNNIGQIAYLQAQTHQLEHIYFGGSFIRGYTATMNTLSYAIKFWSGGSKQAFFLRHEGYLGAVGAFLRHQPRTWGRRFSNPSTSFRPQFSSPPSGNEPAK